MSAQSGIPLALALALVMALGLFAGCGLKRRPATPVTWYTLDYDPPVPENRIPLPVVIQVNRFAVDPVYNNQQMVYSDAEFIRNAYPYRRWRANPGDMATYFLARDLSQCGIFRAALPLSSGVSATHELSGVVEEFYENDLPTGWEAVLTLSITLSRMNEPDVTKRIVFQKRFSEKVRADMENPQAIAKAMSRAMKEISTRVIKEIGQALAAPSSNKEK